jgi:hypothetical protein
MCHGVLQAALFQHLWWRGMALNLICVSQVRQFAVSWGVQGVDQLSCPFGIGARSDNGMILECECCGRSSAVLVIYVQDI